MKKPRWLRVIIVMIWRNEKSDRELLKTHPEVWLLTHREALQY